MLHQNNRHNTSIHQLTFISSCCKALAVNPSPTGSPRTQTAPHHESENVPNHPANYLISIVTNLHQLDHASRSRLQVVTTRVKGQTLAHNGNLCVGVC